MHVTIRGASQRLPPCICVWIYNLTNVRPRGYLQGRRYGLESPATLERKKPGGVTSAAPENVLPRGVGVVLLAEDDEQVRRFSERVLANNGFRVLTAADGHEALALVEQHGVAIRLAVLDVLMPRVSGKQVYERLRSRHPGTRVLFCSGYAAEMLPAEFAPGAGCAILNKPYTSRELLAQVHRLLAT